MAQSLDNNTHCFADFMTSVFVFTIHRFKTFAQIYHINSLKKNQPLAYKGYFIKPT